MNSMLRKLVLGTFGIGCTLIALVLVTALLEKMPLPDVSATDAAYWQTQHGDGGALGTVTQQLGLVAYMLMHVWILWLVPLAGLMVTVLLVTRDLDTGEMAVYLERIHLLEQALADSRNTAELYAGRWDAMNVKFDTLFENSAEMWLVIDRASGIRRWNKMALELARRIHPGIDTLEGRPLSDVVYGHAQTPMAAAIQDALAQGSVWNSEVHLPQMQLHMLVWIFPLGDEVAMVLRDISHRYRDNAFLQSSEWLARQLVEESTRPLAVLDHEWRYIYVSRGWSDVMALDPNATLIGFDHRAKVADFPTERRMFEAQLAAGQTVNRDEERRVVDGREFNLSWNLRPWLDAFGRMGGYIFSVDDATELTRLRQQVVQATDRENALAYSDALTGLPNRQLFNDRLNMSLAQAYRQLGKVALFFLDLDGFKAVNDQLGHDYGDLLLKQVAERLKTCVRNTDTVARLGGDEFTIILAIRDKRDAEQVADKVLATIRAPYDLNGKVADRVGTSIGIALYPQDGTQGAELVRKADAAMYGAKQGGKNAWRFATQEIVVQE